MTTWLLFSLVGRPTCVKPNTAKAKFPMVGLRKRDSKIWYREWKAPKRTALTLVFSGWSGSTAGMEPSEVTALLKHSVGT